MAELGEKNKTFQMVKADGTIIFFVSGMLQCSDLICWENTCYIHK